MSNYLYKKRLLKWRRSSLPASSSKWPRFSLRTLFILTTLFAISLFLFAVPRVKRYQVEQTALSHGGSVVYRHQFTPEGKVDATREPPGPAWLRQILGANVFAELERVELIDPTQEEFDRVVGSDCYSTLVVNSTKRAIADLGALTGTSRLESVQLKGELWTNDQLKTLEIENTSIVSFGLHGTANTDEALSKLTTLQKVEFLWLYDTRIKGTGLSHLEKMKSLKYLGLYGKQIDKSSIPALKHLQQLEVLYLDEIEFSLVQNSIEELRADLPNCHVVWGSNPLGLP